jgi:hypothetical protein
MKPALFAIAAVATLFISQMSVRTASATEAAQRVAVGQAQEFSAARHYRTQARASRRHYGGYAPYRRTYRGYGYGNYGGYYAPPYSLYNYFRSQGRCVVDEGYGRATLCDAL